MWALFAALATANNIQLLKLYSHLTRDEALSTRAVNSCIFYTRAMWSSWYNAMHHRKYGVAI